VPGNVNARRLSESPAKRRTYILSQDSDYIPPGQQMPLAMEGTDRVSWTQRQLWSARALLILLLAVPSMVLAQTTLDTKGRASTAGAVAITHVTVVDVGRAAAARVYAPARWHSGRRLDSRATARS